MTGYLGSDYWADGYWDPSYWDIPESAGSSAEFRRQPVGPGDLDPYIELRDAAGDVVLQGKALAELRRRRAEQREIERQLAEAKSKADQLAAEAAAEIERKLPPLPPILTPEEDDAMVESLMLRAQQEESRVVARVLKSILDLGILRRKR